jgi:hypothetical protein
MGMQMRRILAGAWGYATGLIAVVCLSGAALAMQIDVTSVPKLGTTNRLANSDFEQGVSGPFNWGFSTARPDLLSAQWSEEALHGQKSVSVKATSGEMSGYWAQRAVAVEPNESLLLSAWVKMGGGRVLMYVIGYDGRVSPPKQVYNDRRLYLSAAADIITTLVGSALTAGHNTSKSKRPQTEPNCHIFSDVIYMPPKN